MVRTVIGTKCWKPGFAFLTGCIKRSMEKQWARFLSLAMLLPFHQRNK